jgi:putative sigma-54 modulation protein
MNIIITGRNVEITEGIRTKAEEVLSKHEQLLKKANKITVEVKQGASHGGVDTDLAVEVTVTMPKAFIRVEEKGSDFYVVIDKIDPILRRRLLRYKENRNRWEGADSWKEIEREKYQEEMSDVSDDIYAPGEIFPPIISRNKQFSQNSPMHPVEAIERMELLGHEAFLFKNIESGKYATVYRKRDGTYGLLEPKEG